MSLGAVNDYTRTEPVAIDLQQPIVAQQPATVYGVVHANCDLHPPCSCTVRANSPGEHPGSHTSPHHTWF